MLNRKTKLLTSLTQQLGLCLLLSLVIMACNHSDAPADQQDNVTDTPPANEDDLLMRLSAYLSMDTTRAAREQNAIIDYAIENLLDMQATNSGLFYHIVEQGEGAKIAWADYLKTHYKGYTLDGKVFADSRAQGQPLEFYVGKMIAGWNEGLQLLHVGGTMQLIVPSHLGYGAEGLVSSTGRTVVPPNAILVFELEVLEKVQ